MFFVYILYSEKYDKYYTGHTNNVIRRLSEHNSEKFDHYYTSKFKPWSLKLSIELQDKAIAIKVEKFIKKQKSRKFIEKVIDNPGIIQDIICKTT
jgi:putative endonuclease